MRDRERKLLTREAYQEIGGVAGALAQHAEADAGADRRRAAGDRPRDLPEPRHRRRARVRSSIAKSCCRLFPDRASAPRRCCGELIDARLLTTYEVEEQGGRAEPPPRRDRPRVAPEGVAAARAVADAGRGGRGPAGPAQAGGAPVGGEGTDRATCCGRGPRTASSSCGGSATRERSRPLEEDFARSMADKARRTEAAADGASPWRSWSRCAWPSRSRRRSRAPGQRRPGTGREAEALRAEAGKLLALGRSSRSTATRPRRWPTPGRASSWPTRPTPGASPSRSCGADRWRGSFHRTAPWAARTSRKPCSRRFPTSAPMRSGLPWTA